MSSEIKSTNGLQPKIRFPEFQDAGDWEKKNMSDFLKESRTIGSPGNTAKKITVKLWGKGVYEKKETINGSENTQYYRRKAGSFIYSKLDFLNQAFGIIPSHLDNYESTVDLPCFDISEDLHPLFLLEYVKRKDFYSTLGEIADGGRKAKRIQVETFLSFPIAVPPCRVSMSEQQKIADCLSSLDELIEAESQKLECLQRHRRGLMQELFPVEGEMVPKRRFPEFRDTSVWEEKTLKDICEMQAGKFISASDIFDAKSNELYPCYGGNGLRGYVSAFTHSGKFPIIGRQGALCGNVNLATGVFYATEHAVVATAKPSVNVDWLYYQLIRLNLNQYATGQAQPGLSVDVLNRVVSFTPTDPNEQRRIADVLSSVDAQISAQSDKIDALRNHKNGLTQQLFPAVGEVQE